MKFARQFQDHLLKDGFPPGWVDSAISYGQLKKCIKRVEKELSSLGLDAETLRKLLEAAEAREVTSRRPSAEENQFQDQSHVTSTSVDQDGSPTDDKSPFQYFFKAKPGSKVEPIQPKLVFVVDELSGEPIHATLSAETKNYLHQLAISENLTDVRITDAAETASITSSISSGASNRPVRLVEVPLTTDSEFFGVLQNELCGLAELQEQERKKLTEEIQSLGKKLATIAEPDDRKSKADLQRWRRIFELYLDSRIFFATNELDHGVHNGRQAQIQFDHFLSVAKKEKLMTKFKRKGSAEAMEEFLRINSELLQSLQFQEINQLAMNKILKKFDKRTALGVKGSFPTHLSTPLFSQDFSKALSAQVSTDILSVVPKLDDYTCAICFSIAYRPIRLRCQHFFCIRCLIIMQRNSEDHCPLCREEVVLAANSANLDPPLQKFLERYFPAEVKEKQRANERAAAIDQFGDSFEHPCAVM